MKKGIPITKIHSYNVSVAADVGINAAVIFYNICYWVEENWANKRNYVNGKYWTYNSVKAFETVFPEMNKNQIDYALNKLKKYGYIEYAFLSKDPMDRTKWYTVCDFDKWIVRPEEDAISENPESHSENSENDSFFYECISENPEVVQENSEMINDYNNNIIINTNNKQANNKASKAEKPLNTDEKHDFSSQRKDRWDRYTAKGKHGDDTLDRAYCLCDANYNDDTASEIFRSIEYYFKRFADKTLSTHSPISDDVLYNAINKMTMLKIAKDPESKRVIDQKGGFMKLIDEFFNTSTRVRKGHESNWTFPRFMSDEILNCVIKKARRKGDV